jgi:hypothetical protein
MTPSSAVRRPESLALIFQEVLTAIERLRGSRQGVTDAEAFRHHTREALKSAAAQGLAAGYNADDVRYATFAAVAFLDESILNSQNPSSAIGCANRCRRSSSEPISPARPSSRTCSSYWAATIRPISPMFSKSIISACCSASAAATAREIAANWAR